MHTHTHKKNYKEYRYLQVWIHCSGWMTTEGGTIPRGNPLIFFVNRYICIHGGKGQEEDGHFFWMAKIFIRF